MISGPGHHDYIHEDGRVIVCHVRYMTRAEIVETYRRALTGDLSPSMRTAVPSGGFLPVTAGDVRRDLADRDLASWCPLPASPAEPDLCHAAVLLKVANQLLSTEQGTTAAAAAVPESPGRAASHAMTSAPAPHHQVSQHNRRRHYL